MNLKKILKRLYYRIVNSDPVYNCPVYKEKGCALVDSPYCHFPACNQIDKHLGEEWTCCAACRHQDECSSSQFGFGCFCGEACGKEGQFSDSDRRCAENFGFDYLDVE